MLDGKCGWPQQLAMRMLVALGRAQDAERLIPVASVHLGMSGMSMAEPGMRLLEKLAGNGGKFVVPTTLNILSMDRRQAGTIDAQRAQEQVQLRIARACEAMGADPTYTCNPFLLGVAPSQGQSVAWNESATAPYVNSILGARTNREGATALASALTGSTPEYGMHVAENRLGTVVMAVDTPVSGSDDFGLLGGAVARACGKQLPVIEGLERPPTLDEMAAFSSAFAAVGPLAMVHMVGITPEAPDRAAALAPGAGATVSRIGAAELAYERRAYSTAKDERLDVVAIGCPHASLAQVREVADALGEERVAPSVRFIVQVNQSCADQAGRSGLAERLVAAGVALQSDTCVHVAYDQIEAGRTLATNSLKIAYLTASHDVHVRLGSLHECVRAAVAGRWLG